MNMKGFEYYINGIFKFVGYIPARCMDLLIVVKGLPHAQGSSDFNPNALSA